MLRPNAVLVVEQKRLDCLNRADGFSGGLLDRCEHVENPLFPHTAVAHTLQQPIVVGFGAHNVPAQIEHGNVEQPLLHEVEDVDDSAGAPIAIIEWMDALELMM